MILQLFVNSLMCGMSVYCMILDASFTKASQRCVPLDYLMYYTMTQQIDACLSTICYLITRNESHLASLCFMHLDTSLPASVKVGFGHSDGEGCERVWNQLLKEIPMLRVSGVCQIVSYCDVSNHICSITIGCSSSTREVDCHSGRVSESGSGGNIPPGSVACTV